ncbi:MAG: DUF3119 family protein [Potamolinea sp.]
MTSAAYKATSNQTVKLSPSYTLPLVLVFAAVPLLFIQIWVSLAIGIFGLFLMFQAVTIRLEFTETALDVYRSETMIRRFPYQDWINWRIFWPSLPILFYFKEVKSIHFLPVLFDPKMLKTCLEQRCPKI